MKIANYKHRPSKFNVKVNENKKCMETSTLQWKATITLKNNNRTTSK
jgi:hypothetical protein